MADWHWIRRLALDWRIGVGILDWKWIGDGLALDWHQIGIRLAKDRLSWLALDWHSIGNGLALDRPSPSINVLMNFIQISVTPQTTVN